MSRFHLKFSLSLLLLFTLPMLLIHAQPYDDHELRQFLMPDGCEMPCFMGIQPGVTTVEEAVNVVEKSEWVTEFNNRYSNGANWRWTDAAPRLIDRRGSGFMEYPQKTIYHMEVLTTVSVIEITWILGLPAQVLWEYAPTDDHKFIYFFWYPSRGLAVQVITAACASSMIALTKRESVLYLYSAQEARKILDIAKAFPNFRDIPLSQLNLRKVC